MAPASSVSTIGQRFAQLIQQLGLSKNAFAVSLDKTATVIQHLVDERNKPGYDLLCKVFEVYPNVSKDWLLLGQGPMLLNGAASPSAAARSRPALASAPPPAASAVVTTPTFPVVANAELNSAAAPINSEASPTPAATLPVSAEQAAAPASAASAPGAPGAPGAAPTQSLELTAPASAAPPAAAVEAVLTAALHTQHLQHQLALAEQRNQHLLEQQQLMQQLVEVLQRR